MIQVSDFFTANRPIFSHKLSISPAAPFGLITESKENAIPIFLLPSLSYFRTSLFGIQDPNNAYVDESTILTSDEIEGSSSKLSVMSTIGMGLLLFICVL